MDETITLNEARTFLEKFFCLEDLNVKEMNAKQIKETIERFELEAYEKENSEYYEEKDSRFNYFCHNCDKQAVFNSISFDDDTDCVDSICSCCGDEVKVSEQFFDSWKENQEWLSERVCELCNK